MLTKAEWRYTKGVIAGAFAECPGIHVSVQEAGMYLAYDVRLARAACSTARRRLPDEGPELTNGYALLRATINAFSAPKHEGRAKGIELARDAIAPEE